MSTSEELLSSVENAITAFLQNGAVEEYSLADGRRIRRSDVSTLFNLRDKLKREISAGSRGSVSLPSFKD